MEASFWLQVWQEGRLGFHRDSPHPVLIEHASRFLVEGAPVFVPLCGKSHDLRWLRARGHAVVGVELAEKAVLEFFAEDGVEVEPDADGCFAAQGYRLFCRDFFELGPETLGRFASIYDRAAVVALPESKRVAYAQRVRSLLAPGGRILQVTLEHDTPSGPPFSVVRKELSRLYGDLEIEELACDDIIDEVPRFRERGLKYLLRRVSLLQAQD